MSYKLNITSEEFSKRIEIYPIGSIYISLIATEPSNIFGGTWERIEDTFLLAAGDNYVAGATGGEAEHVLTISELPEEGAKMELYVLRAETGQNQEEIKQWQWYFKGGNGQFIQNSTASTTTISGNYNRIGGHAITYNKWKSEAHNNMPPYLVVYMWKRIA